MSPRLLEVKRGRRVGRTTAGLVAVLFGSLSCGEPAPAPRPDIVFVVYDDLHYDNLGAYGGTYIRTPNIDRLAREGMRFTQFYSNSPVCSPARIALLTGLYPGRLNIRSVLKKGPLLPVAGHGTDRAGAVFSNRGIPAEVTTLPEVLNARGYRTVHLGKWHAGDGKNEFRPRALGFDQTTVVLGRMPEYYSDPTLWAGESNRWFEVGHSTDVITERAVEILTQRDDRPVFLNLWYPAPHAPLEPTPRWAAEYPANDLGRFAAMVAQLDEAIGTLVSALEASGRRDDTLIVVTSDNGGVEDLVRKSSLRGSKNGLFEGGIRVPFIASWPGRVERGAVNDSVLMGADLLPTFAELAGLDVDDLEVDGESFAPVLRGERERIGERLLFWEHRRPATRPDGVRLDQFAVRDGDMKLLVEGPRSFLFDLGEDPREEFNLARDRPEVVAALEAEYQRWRLEIGRLDYSVLGTRGAVTLAPPRPAEREAAGAVARASFEGLGSIMLRPDALFDFHDGDFSAAVWVRLAPEAFPRALFLERQDTWRLGLAAGDRPVLRIAGEDGSSFAVQAQTPLERGKWHHVAFTVGGTSLERKTFLKLYVDGRRAGHRVLPVSPASNEHSVLLGGFRPCRRCWEPGNEATQGYFIGELADLRLYTMEMSAEEIAQLAARAPGDVAPEEIAARSLGEASSD